jgi:hypothetical protein
MKEKTSKRLGAALAIVAIFAMLMLTVLPLFQ